MGRLRTTGPASPVRPRGPGGPMGPGRPLSPSLPGEPAEPGGPWEEEDGWRSPAQKHRTTSPALQRSPLPSRPRSASTASFSFILAVRRDLPGFFFPPPNPCLQTLLQRDTDTCVPDRGPRSEPGLGPQQGKVDRGTTYSGTSRTRSSRRTLFTRRALKDRGKGSKTPCGSNVASNLPPAPLFWTSSPKVSTG